MHLRQLVFIVSCFASAACGSQKGGATSTGSTCTTTFTALCQRACSCGGTNCPLVAIDDAGTSASFVFDDLQDCQSFYALGCAMPGAVRANFDYGACTSAAQAAACVASPGGGMGVSYPPVCNPNPPTVGDAG
jgi:hypothetical protein